MGAWTLLMALVPRLLFSVHAFITVWRVVATKNDEYYWLLMVGTMLMLCELIVALIKKRGEENRWFSPSVFLFLCTVVPAIWLLELDRLGTHLDKEANLTAIANETVGLSSIEGVQIPIQLSRDMWVLIIEQSLLFLLIIGRWLLPKGDISRDQLSQLLFVYIGIASDISEIFVLFGERFVIERQVLIYIILGVWTLSLLQYTVVLTATKARKTRVVHAQSEEAEEARRRREGITTTCSCLEKETWAIITTVLMQDGPFLCVRLYVIIASGSLTYTILFYTFKNALVMALQFYRVIVITCEVDQKEEEEEEVKVEENDKKPTSDQNGVVETHLDYKF